MEIGKIQRAIDAIKNECPNYERILDLFGKIMIKQSEFLSKTEIQPVAIAKDVAQARLRKGTPVLKREDFRIDVSSASRLFEELCNSLKSEDRKLGDEIRKIESSLQKREDKAWNIEEILQSALTDGRRIADLSEELSLDGDILLALATASLKPSIEIVAASVRSLLEDVPWSGHCCPVCGSSQAISELRKPEHNDDAMVGSEGAERILHCSFCESEWRVARLGCTFCGNSDTESLRYLYIEGTEAYRIDVCEKCNRYIKTVDSESISHEIVPAVEDIATLHLDIIAEEEGYRREAWFLPYQQLSTTN